MGAPRSGGHGAVAGTGSDSGGQSVCRRPTATPIRYEWLHCRQRVRLAPVPRRLQIGDGSTAGSESGWRPCPADSGSVMAPLPGHERSAQGLADKRSDARITTGAESARAISVAYVTQRLNRTNGNGSSPLCQRLALGYIGITFTLRAYRHMMSYSYPCEHV